ncbi:chaperone protein dnaJ 20, chloroplastic-like [Olea europaea var. sylvestris]|uniref:chaperone protein dnaJ 20, chloroplastic-like n=1 Tax=Olea europaea var. sylvestris TaxID=158386 RepID=UPI000C1D1A11|nr:chaperone protein dnaJ 20, chloroplastic-like [Olea europaea var. sylvestris]
MSCAVVSGSETCFHFCSKPDKPTKNCIPETVSSVSFGSQLTKSRIQIKTPLGISRNKRCRASFKAFNSSTQSTDSFYDLLGITESGTIADIKKAYKQMARTYHPDVSPPERVDEYTRRFILVKEAYETLSDPHTRALYDRDLASGMGFNFSAGRGYEYNQRSEERHGEWKMRWQSQLNDLKQRKTNSGERMSWGARMRSRR